jgi:Family of unknown function (DUF6010)
MALSIITVLYVCVGILATAGSIFISQKLFSPKAEQIFFALFLVAIAGFYLAFTAYFEDQGAWRLETEAVIVFGVFGILGLRFPAVLIIGYCLHGIWDVGHEVHAYGGGPLRRFLRSFRLVRGRLFLHSAARVECGLEGACPLNDHPR